MSERPTGGGRRQLNRFSVEKPADEVIDSYCLFYSSKDLYWNPEKLPPIDSETIFANQNPLVLDIGCGRGEFVIGMGKQNPDINYIGIDFHLKALWDGINHANEQNLQNVKFISSDARRILLKVPDGSIAEIYVLFPPPVRKRKHMKKDFLTREFISEIHRCLKKGGTLSFATDHEDYFLEKKRLIEDANLFLEVSFTRDLEGGVTWYQRVWESHDLKTWRLEFKK